MNGPVYLTWTEFDGSNNRLRLMHSKDHGKSWTKVETLASGPGEADSPFLIRDEHKVYVSWHIPNVGYRLIPIE
ncbi:MAG: hypothetical protein ACRERV_06550 [Methylococcales bacterium]